MNQAVAAPPLAAREVQAIGLVTAAHFLSHFYQLVLPPVLTVMAVRLDVGFTELGLAMTLFSISTGVAQTPIGFLVDRLGAAKILTAGLAVLGGAVACYGLAPNIWVLCALACVGGAANAVFHPADFAILSDRVAEQRIGRAFSYHAVSGNLGWAAAPVAMLWLTTAHDVETAFLTVGLAGVALAVVLALNIGRLEDRVRRPETPSSGKRSPAAAPGDGKGVRDGLDLLLSRPALMLFGFQLIYAMGFGGVRNFSVAALPQIWDISADVVAGALSGYLLAASVGNLAGGWLADATGNPGRVFTFSIIVLAAIVASLASVPMSAALLTAALLTAGGLQGSLLPARDMLVRQIAPKGQMGKLFGFTSSGLALGNAATPVACGWILDHADVRLIFWGSAALMLLALFTYVETRRQAS